MPIPAYLMVVIFALFSVYGVYTTPALAHALVGALQP
jgi:hypothetical protein